MQLLLFLPPPKSKSLRRLSQKAATFVVFHFFFGKRLFSELLSRFQLLVKVSSWRRTLSFDASKVRGAHGTAHWCIGSTASRLSRHLLPLNSDEKNASR
jgi:hypothetical protein